MNELREINLVSGVNEQGEGFITVSCVSGSRELMVGQLSPSELRDHGQACFEGAEAAETDAIVFRLLRDKFELPLEVIAGFISDMRASRGD